jgi:hypothetical protein
MRTATSLVSLLVASLAVASAVPDARRAHNEIAQRRSAEPEPEEDFSDASLYQDAPYEEASEFDERDLGTSDANAPDIEDRGVPKTKACLAWTNEMANGLKSFQNKGIFGMYTWSEWCPDKTFGINCWPMLWGNKNKDKFKKKVVKGYANVALGMNEVNCKGQSTMSPGAAASLWRQYMLPLKSKGYTLISPSTSNGKTAPAWLNQWFKTCKECGKSIHAVAAHYYGTDPKKFISYITDLHHQTGNRTIWVTEIGCQDYSGRNKQCSQSQANNFLTTAINWMEKTSWVETYCWYGMFHKSRVGVSSVNGMFNSNGTLNNFGKLYVSKSSA